MATERLNETVRRRVRAGRLLLAAKTRAEAANAVGVAQQTAYTWKAVLDEGGIDALRAMRSRGRPARLDLMQLQTLGRLLLDKPTKHVFVNGLWVGPNPDSWRVRLVPGRAGHDDWRPGPGLRGDGGWR